MAKAGNMRELGPLSLEHRPVYDEYLRRYPTEISEHSFTNFFIWRKSRPIHTIETGDSLVAFEEREDGVILFGSPIGPLPLSDAVDAVSSVTGKDVVLCDRIPQKPVSAGLPGGYEVVEDRDYFDYVYRQSDLATLEGRRYHKKRNLISQCLASHSYEYEGIGQQNIAEVSAMMDRWCDYRGCKGDRGLCNEFRATRELFQNYASLDAIGAAIRIDGEIQAFTVGESLNGTTAVVHFEKAMPEFKGLYQLINQRFSAEHLGEFEYVNREEDVGLAGLRQAKESYYPEMLVKKYKVYPLGRARAQLKEPVEFERCLDEEG